MDKGLVTGAIFLDLKKAFDVIPHPLIIKKMLLYGIGGVELEWFESYLSNRQQCVFLQGTKSNFLTVKSGIPQGSILGPLIFCLYVNDICNLQLHSKTKISLYADDTAVFHHGKDYKVCEYNLQKDFTRILKWLKYNGLFLNANKTKTILFGSKRKIQNNNICIRYSENVLDSVESMKYLGVTLDKSLTWSLHVKEVVKKVSGTIACIRRIRNYISRKNLITLYYSLILPHLNYCNSVWGNTSKQNLTKLQKLQNRYARLVLRAEYFTPQNVLMSKLKWRSLEERIKYQKCILIFKIINDLSPPYLNPCISKRTILYSTRYALNSPLFIPKCKTNFKTKTLAVSGAKIYNKLPYHIKNCKSLQSFKKNVKTFQFPL